MGWRQHYLLHSPIHAFLYWFDIIYQHHDLFEIIAISGLFYRFHLFKCIKDSKFLVRLIMITFAWFFEVCYLQVLIYTFNSSSFTIHEIEIYLLLILLIHITTSKGLSTGDKLVTIDLSVKQNSSITKLTTQSTAN